MSNKNFPLCSILKSVFSEEDKFNIEHMSGGGGLDTECGSVGGRCIYPTNMRKRFYIPLRCAGKILFFCHIALR